MWTKIKTWFKENLNGFLLSLLVPIGFIVLILILPKWHIILISSLVYLAILAYKIWKNKPF